MFCNLRYVADKCRHGTPPHEPVEVPISAFWYDTVFLCSSQICFFSPLQLDFNASLSSWCSWWIVYCLPDLNPITMLDSSLRAVILKLFFFSPERSCY